MADEHPVTRSLELLWHGLPRSRKGPRPSLTLEQIVLAGVAIADGEGLEALSMRALARDLGVGTMSLYRYVADKADLMNLILDHVTGRYTDRIDTGHGWRSTLESAAHKARDMYLSHPWLLQVNWSRPVLGRESLEDLERTLTGLDGLPFSDRKKIMLVSLVDSFVVGSVRQEVQYDLAAAESGTTHEQFWELQLPFLEPAMASGQFPVMAAMSEDSFSGGWDESFELGLRLLLDGIAQEIERAGTT